MSLTKEQTDTLILTQAGAGDNEVNTTYFRNTSSVHPRDCHCFMCVNTKFSDSVPSAENNYKVANNWWMGD